MSWPILFSLVSFFCISLISLFCFFYDPTLSYNSCVWYDPSLMQLFESLLHTFLLPNTACTYKTNDKKERKTNVAPSKHIGVEWFANSQGRWTQTLPLIILGIARSLLNQKEPLLVTCRGSIITRLKPTMVSFCLVYFLDADKKTFGQLQVAFMSPDQDHNNIFKYVCLTYHTKPKGEIIDVPQTNERDVWQTIWQDLNKTKADLVFLTIETPSEHLVTPLNQGKCNLALQNSTSHTEEGSWIFSDTSSRPPVWMYPMHIKRKELLSLHIRRWPRVYDTNAWEGVCSSKSTNMITPHDGQLVQVIKRIVRVDDVDFVNVQELLAHVLEKKSQLYTGQLRVILSLTVETWSPLKKILSAKKSWIRLLSDSMHRMYNQLFYHSITLDYQLTLQTSVYKTATKTDLIYNIENFWFLATPLPMLVDTTYIPRRASYYFHRESQDVKMFSLLVMTQNRDPYFCREIMNKWHAALQLFSTFCHSPLNYRLIDYQPGSIDITRVDIRNGTVVFLFDAVYHSLWRKIMANMCSCNHLIFDVVNASKEEDWQSAFAKLQKSLDLEEEECIIPTIIHLPPILKTSIQDKMGVATVFDRKIQENILGESVGGACTPWIKKSSELYFLFHYLSDSTKGGKPCTLTFAFSFYKRQSLYTEQPWYAFAWQLHAPDLTNVLLRDIQHMRRITQKRRLNTGKRTIVYTARTHNVASGYSTVSEDQEVWTLWSTDVVELISNFLASLQINPPALPPQEDGPDKDIPSVRFRDFGDLKTADPLFGRLAARSVDDFNAYETRYESSKHEDISWQSRHRLHGTNNTNIFVTSNMFHVSNVNENKEFKQAEKVQRKEVDEEEADEEEADEEEADEEADEEEADEKDVKKKADEEKVPEKTEVKREAKVGAVPSATFDLDFSELDLQNNILLYSTRYMDPTKIEKDEIEKHEKKQKNRLIIDGFRIHELEKYEINGWTSIVYTMGFVRPHGYNFTPAEITRHVNTSQSDVQDTQSLVKKITKQGFPVMEYIIVDHEHDLADKDTFWRYIIPALLETKRISEKETQIIVPNLEQVLVHTKQTYASYRIPSSDIKTIKCQDNPLFMSTRNARHGSMSSEWYWVKDTRGISDIAQFNRKLDTAALTDELFLSFKVHNQSAS